MVRACSFATWKIYIKFFLKHYTAAPPTASHKQSGVVEAEEADRRAFQEACSLVEAGWSLDDALHEVAVYRDRFSVLLMHQLKPSGVKRLREWEGAASIVNWAAAPDEKGKGKGKGKSKGTKGGKSTGEPCRRFAQGRCQAGDRCKYSHE